MVRHSFAPVRHGGVVWAHTHIRSVLSTYLPSMYIPSANERPVEGAIRYLSTNSSTPLSSLVPKLSSPNYATGLSAALATLATHPASARLLNLLTLPLPLSSIPKSDINAVLSSVAPSLTSRLENSAKSASSRWDETHDEPFSGPGMGHRKKTTKHELAKEDFSGMYM